MLDLQPHSTTLKAVHLERFYKVLIHNDDHNKFLHAVEVVACVFRLTRDRAWAIVAIAHTQGVACCERRLAYEVAEHHRDSLQAYGYSASLTVDD